MDDERPPLPPEDTTASKLSYDNWFTTELPDDIREEFAQLDRVIAEKQPARPEAREAVLRIGRVDPVTGDFEGGGACWVCYAQYTHIGVGLPAFRACQQCLAYDRHRARALGLVMLLPLMDWHTQPVLRDFDVPNDTVFRSWLDDAWTQLSLLEAWRIDGVRAGIALLGLGDRPTVWEWIDAMHPSPARSRACWEAFMAGHHPRLYDVLNRIDRINRADRQGPSAVSPS